jgi:hypothetical protein
MPCGGRRVLALRELGGEGSVRVGVEVADADVAPRMELGTERIRARQLTKKHGGRKRRDAEPSWGIEINLRAPPDDALELRDKVLDVKGFRLVMHVPQALRKEKTRQITLPKDTCAQLFIRRTQQTWLR